MDMNDEDALTFYLFIQMKEVIEAQYGPENLRICAAISNDVTMRPSADLELINYCKNHRDLIENAILHLKHFPEIIDTISALVDMINAQRIKNGEVEIANACLERTKTWGLYVENSPGKAEMLKQSSMDLGGKHSARRNSNGGCLGMILFLAGLSSTLLIALVHIIL